MPCWCDTNHRGETMSEQPTTPDELEEFEPEPFEDVEEDDQGDADA